MKEKRLECIIMPQIHRSDTSNISAFIDRFATTAARRLNFLLWYTCTSRTTRTDSGKKINSSARVEPGLSKWVLKT